MFEKLQIVRSHVASASAPEILAMVVATILDPEMV
jgi:hypothetical protein